MYHTSENFINYFYIGNTIVLYKYKMIFVPIFAYLINIYGGCTQSKMRPFTAPSHINMKLHLFKIMIKTLILSQLWGP